MRETQDLTEHILSVARDRFLEVGYEATSIDEIIERASISNQTFYNRFDNKASLFEEVLRQFLKSVLDERRRLDPDLLDLPIDDALVEFSERLLQQLMGGDTLEFERLVFANVKQFPQISDVIRSTLEAIQAMVAILLGASETRGDVEIDDVERFARWFVEGAISPRLRRAALGLAEPNFTDADREELRAYVAFYLRGILSSSGGLRCKKPVGAQ